MGAPASGPRRYHMGRGPWQAGMNGLGQAVAGQVAQTGVVAAGTIVSGVATSSIAAGGTFLTIGSTAIAVPVIGAIVAGVCLALALIFNRKGPKQRVATTEIVNKIEPLLQDNLAGYMSGPRTVSSQAQALENFKAGWAYVVEYCDTPAMGDPGQHCVSDRQPGGQWDWKSYYYDPIAQDTGVIPDPVEGSVVVRNADGTVTVTQPANPLDSVVSAVAGIPMPLMLGIGALVVAMTMGGKR